MNDTKEVENQNNFKPSSIVDEQKQNGIVFWGSTEKETNETI